MTTKTRYCDECAHRRRYSEGAAESPPCELGHNPWYVSAQLGHEDVEMVFRTYGKFIREDYQKPAAPKLRAVA